MVYSTCVVILVIKVMVLVLLGSVKPESFVIVGPEVEDEQAGLRVRDIYCVSEDTNGALVWNQPVTKHTQRHHTTFLVVNDTKLRLRDDDFNGNVESRWTYNRAGYWSPKEGWDETDNLVEPMYPVYDERWEGYPEVLLNNKSNFGNQVYYDYFPSVRGTGLVYFDKLKTEIDNKTQNTLQNCSSNSQTWKIDSQLKWKEMVMLNSSLNTEPMGSFCMTSNNPDREPIVVKFSRYTYLRTRKTQSKIISPLTYRPFQNESYFCLEISVSLCPECMFTFDLIDSNNQSRPAATILGKQPSNPYKLSEWQTVRINKRIPKGFVLPLGLKVTTLATNKTGSEKFWAISRTQRCYEDSYKITTMRIQQEKIEHTDNKWPNTVCQKFNKNDSILISPFNKFTNDSGSRAFQPLCPEGKIGKSCSLSCSILFGRSACRGITLCDENNCFCPEGFVPKEPCNTFCLPGNYGVGCAKTCGNCASESCSPTNGECKLGCEESDEKYFVKPYCKMYVEKPSEPHVELINPTTARIYMDMKETYKIVKTSFHCYVQNSENQTIFNKMMLIESNTVAIDLFAENLKPGITYNVLCSLIMVADNKTFFSPIKYFNTPCTASGKANFQVTANETNILLNNIHDGHSNDSCPPSWYRVRLQETLTNLTLFEDVPKSFPMNFTDLREFTPYKFTISRESTMNPLAIKKIKTLEGVPSAVTNVHLSASTRNIDIKWGVPEHPRGLITNYTIFIKRLKAYGCSDFNLTQTNETQLNFYTETDLFKNINDLHPYSKYQIVIFASTSRFRGIATTLNISTEAIDVPSEKFDNLRFNAVIGSITTVGFLEWSIPKICSEITGKISGAKLLIRKTSEQVHFMIKEISSFNFSLAKDDFIGAEMYQVHLHVLRSLGKNENSSAYTTLTFRIPDREPPQVRDAEITEVNVIEESLIIRWNAPKSPWHGVLNQYSVIFYSQQFREFSNKTYIPIDQHCAIWINSTCANIPFSQDRFFNEIQIRSHNRGVQEPSEPVSLIEMREEFAPLAPQQVIVDIIESNIYDGTKVNISWEHPWKTGGRLAKFFINVNPIESRLKEERIPVMISYEIDFYQHFYNIETTLDFPSTNVDISVAAETVKGLLGNPKSGKTLIFPDQTYFSGSNLSLIVEEDLEMKVLIPEIRNDIQGSILLVIIKSFRRKNTYPSLPLLFNIQDLNRDSSIVALLKDHDIFSEKEFIIGDGKLYGGFINKELKLEKSYVLYLALVERTSQTRENNGELNIDSNENYRLLTWIKTQEFRVKRKNYSVELAIVFSFVFFMFVVSAGVLVFVCRTRLIDYFCKRNTKLYQSQFQEHESIQMGNKMTEKVSSEIEPDVEDNLIEFQYINKPMQMPRNEVDIKTSINLEDFGEYLKKSLRDGLLVSEYSAIPKRCGKSHEYGAKEEVKSKNRYANLFPYDDTRVILEGNQGDFSNYINANFITGYEEREKAYIATQGPISTTIEDFWKMVCQERVRLICMVTNLVENDKIKCDRYWPDKIQETLIFENILVTLVEERQHPDFVVRLFRIQVNNESREVYQLHYTNWPEQEPPPNLKSIVSFLREMQKVVKIPGREDEGAVPILVHCSAGIGRTGALILLDRSIERAARENALDIFTDLSRIRESRMNMLDNPDQYLLVHLILDEYFNSRDSVVKCDSQLLGSIESAKQRVTSDFLRIIDLTGFYGYLRNQTPSLCKSPPPPDKSKCRFPELYNDGLPNRVQLNRTSISLSNDSNRYVTGTILKGFGGNGAQNHQANFIATQLPLPTTAVDFWRMIAEFHVGTCLVLESPDLQDSSYCELVQDNQEFGNSFAYLKVTLVPHTYEDRGCYSSERVRVIDSSERKSKVVRILRCKSRSPTLESSNFCDLLRAAHESWLNAPDCPIVLVCRDGVSACGLWLSAYSIFRQISLYGEFDALATVVALRNHRRAFVTADDQLNYLYDLAWAIHQESERCIILDGRSYL